MGDEEPVDEIESLETDLEPLQFEGLEAPRRRDRTKITTHQATEKYGAKNSDHLVKQEKTKAALANREIIRRLMKDPAEFKVSELNFIAGTAVDKVAKKERWERAGGDGGQGWMEQFVQTFARIQEGGSVSLQLTVEKAPPRQVEARVVPLTLDATVVETDYSGDGTLSER